MKLYLKLMKMFSSLLEMFHLKCLRKISIHDPDVTPGSGFDRAKMFDQYSETQMRLLEAIQQPQLKMLMEKSVDLLLWVLKKDSD